MELKSKNILIIDDSSQSIKLLINLLSDKYTVYFAKNGARGIELARDKKPDLILLDILMPEMDGYEVCEQLKLEKSTKDIPIIFLTAVSEAMDEARAFEVGGTDFITKPFVPVTCLARIDNALRLNQYMLELKDLYRVALDSNPITGLPGNNSIMMNINEAIKLNKKESVLYIDLDNFKAYNDKYGFANGDNVILRTAEMVKRIARDIDPDAFVGHVGGDDFIVKLGSDLVDEYVEDLFESLLDAHKEFYDADDLEKGFIESKSRQNVAMKFDLISISIGIVDLPQARLPSYLHVSDHLVQLKSLAKKTKGNSTAKDRRQMSE